MKTKTNSYIRKIKLAANELQTYSYTEFQKMLPDYINHGLNYTLLDRCFEDETGISIKDYFNHMKILKASELFIHYKLSPIEVAYQLGFRTPSTLKKVFGNRKQFSVSRIQYPPGLYRRTVNMPKYF